MTLQDYIDKYGLESGTKRYNGMLKLLESRKITYETHPFKRLTKDWFLWRYPGDGLQRFENHVNKSRQSEENMIARHGEELGKEIWKQTVKKKKTIDIVRQTRGEEGIIAINKKRKDSRRLYLESMSDNERINKFKETGIKISATKKRLYGNRTKLEIYLEKYGENGHEKYAKYLQNIFKSIGNSIEATNLIKSIIDNNIWLTKYSLYYRDSNDLDKKEWFISNKYGVWFYDFCVREPKAILEYDGSKWHPTKEQAEMHGEEIMEIIGKSYIERYKEDQLKIKMALDNQFKVFLIRSDMTIDEKSFIINEFINYIKEFKNE